MGGLRVVTHWVGVGITVVLVHCRENRAQLITNAMLPYNAM